MDVTLYVYDLSRGLARQLSQSFLGTHIDAVYHTAIVFDGIEYFFGQGIQTSLPENTHHGQPMQRIPLGETQIPIDVILEYLESLKTIYTVESYDLFLHNCNNFSNDFAMFLVGRGIPDHITSLPQTVLNTPFGQMLKPQLDQALRGITQAPVPSLLQQLRTSTHGNSGKGSLVNTPRTLTALRPLLEQALNSCALLFFTSSSCPPCKICYEPFETLAMEFRGKAILIKIDISQARDVAAKYSIRATPTFITMLRGEELDRWSGADITKLQGNTRILIQMAHPPHPHTQLPLPILQKDYRPCIYSKVPPLDKLIARLDTDLQTTPEISSLRSFITTRANTSKAANIVVPDLARLSHFLGKHILQRQPNKIFPLVDLLRLALLELRVSGYFAAEAQSISLVCSLVARASKLEIDTDSYPFLLTTIQALSNTFTSPLSLSSVLAAPTLHTLVSNGLLAAGHVPLRAASANLVFNIASAQHARVNQVQDRQDVSMMEDTTLIEFVISILEALKQELDRETKVEKEAMKALTLSIGLLLYCAPKYVLEELKDILEAVEAKVIIHKIGKEEGLDDIVADILSILP